MTNKCNICGKEFKDQLALTQHTHAKHPNQAPGGAQKAKPGRRRRRRGNRAGGPGGLIQSSTIVPQPIYDVRRGSGIRKLAAGRRISPAGMSFLRCAFAPPDFSSTGVQGLPDAFSGKSVLVQYADSASLSCVAGNTTFIVLAPIPGFRHATYADSSGSFASSDQLVISPYSQTRTLMANPARMADNVTSFRVISNHIEVVCLSNATKWSGSIKVYKAYFKMSARAASGIMHVNVEGLDSLNETPPDHVLFAAKDGCYAVSYRDNIDFEFQPIIEGLDKLPDSIDTGDFGTIKASDGNGLPGLDNGMETLIIKIEGVTSDALSLNVRTWQCVEYKATPGSPIAQFVHFSPDHDPTAMELYGKIVKQLPIAVPVAENASFWERVWGITKSLLGLASKVPGPVGLIATGASAIGEGIEHIAR